MHALTKLAGVAIGAVSVVAVVAVAQPNASTESTMNPATANYGTPPGAPLKRDGSLSADPVVTTPAATVGDTSSTTRTTTTTTNWNNPPAAAPVAAEPAPAYTGTDNTSTTFTKPRADRN